jgi:phosphatidylinositol 3-kinase
VPGEVQQALDMLQLWAPMDVEDALELLSSNFTHPAVRRYAVTRLKQAPDEVDSSSSSISELLVLG